MELNIAAILLSYFVFLFSLSFHEFAHAAIADRCGDPSARLLGRVTLNPIAHADPVGTVVMPLILFFTGAPFLFGWAKPVPFNPRNLNDIRRDPVLIAFAGPMSNILLAVVGVVAGRITMLLLGGAAMPPLVEGVFGWLIGINLVLAVFNLIPVPPLDGHYLLHYVLPESGQRAMERIGPFGILIAIIVSRPLFRSLWPVFDAITNFALGQ